MSDEHRSASEALTLGRRGWERFNAGDLDGLWELVHPDIVMATDPRWPGGGEYRGLEAYKRFMAQFTEAFASVRFEEEREPETVGEWALFRGRWIGPGATSGIETPSPWFTVAVRVHDARIGEMRFFFLDEEARDYVRPQA